jgi:protein-disulfide isomerase/uncharacterized membrane protein
LAITGVGVSVKLTEIHYQTHTDPQYHSVCAVNEDVNCETVARSPYSVFLGTPVSVWGILGYLIIGLFAAWGLFYKRIHPLWPFGVLTLLFAVAAGGAGLLAYISFTLIDSLCLFCTALYIINIALVGLIIVFAVTSRVNLLKAVVSDIRGLASKPAVFITLFALFASISVALPLAITPYWHHPGWTDLADLPTGVDEKGRHWIGATDPLVTVVEFSDYQCPFCRRAHKNMRVMAARYPKTVRLIHRHLPLDKACNDDVKREFHEHACLFSRAAECASRQGHFWEMNDALFSIQNDMRADDVDVEVLAVSIGVDRSQFKECMAEKRVPPEIQKDLTASRSLKIKGTPTFLLDGQPFEGGIPPEALHSAVKRAEKK